MARGGFVEDISACYTLHRSLGLPYSDASWRALPNVWRVMLVKGTMKLFVVEDRARPLGSRIDCLRQQLRPYKLSESSDGATISLV